MIICDRHEFAFVHIPKNAGSSVRRQIREYDDCKGLFSDVQPHERLGRIDFGHIPLATLRAEFPAELEKLRAYTAYAVIRNPLERFGSSLRQTLHFYEGKLPAEMTAEEIRTHTARLIARLRANPEPLDPQLIFFARQIDFVDLDGERITDRLYPLERVSALIEDISRRVGVPLDTQRRANRDLSFRSRALIRPAYAVNDLFFRHAPAWLHEGVKRAVVPLLTHRGSATQRLGVTEDAMVKDFVSEHYAADIALYRSLVAAPTQVA